MIYVHRIPIFYVYIHTYTHTYIHMLVVIRNFIHLSLYHSPSDVVEYILKSTTLSIAAGYNPHHQFISELYFRLLTVLKGNFLTCTLSQIVCDLVQ